MFELGLGYPYIIITYFLRICQNDMVMDQESLKVHFNSQVRVCFQKSCFGGADQGQRGHVTQLVSLISADCLCPYVAVRGVSHDGQFRTLSYY